MDAGSTRRRKNVRTPASGSSPKRGERTSPTDLASSSRRKESTAATASASATAPASPWAWERSGAEWSCAPFALSPCGPSFSLSSPSPLPFAFAPLFLPPCRGLRRQKEAALLRVAADGTTDDLAIPVYQLDRRRGHQA